MKNKATKIMKNKATKIHLLYNKLVISINKQKKLNNIDMPVLYRIISNCKINKKQDIKNKKILVNMVIIILYKFIERDINERINIIDTINILNGIDIIRTIPLIKKINNLIENASSVYDDILADAEILNEEYEN